MTVDLKSATNTSRTSAQIKAEERAIWHRLVVKVLRWSQADSPDSSSESKITAEEWKFYSEQTQKINLSQDKNTILEKLALTKEKITKNNGFV